MTGTVAITDAGWYRFLSDRPDIAELNFWTPSARRGFRAPQFSPFLFKLRAPHNAICGFAYFAQFSQLPDWLAWESFGPGNGCASFAEMQARIAAIRARIRYDEQTGSDEIGCIQLVSPVFFTQDSWVSQPRDWQPRTQTPVKYDLATGEGRRVWEACLSQMVDARPVAPASEFLISAERGPRYGEPRLVQPRLGQGTFRIAVLDAYGRGCAVTGEHSLPALEASHIRPYAHDGPHEIRNGLLLRADLQLEISARLREDYQNGRSYYPLQGAHVQVPRVLSHQPDKAFLEWHNEHIFRG